MFYLASVLIVAGAALFVAAPFIGGERGARQGRLAQEFARLQHERASALQGLRELEFDLQMHKLSEPDALELRSALEGRALAAMAAIERLEGEARSAAVRAAGGGRHRASGAQAAAAPTPAGRFCPECGAAVARKANFCAECGRAFRPADPAMIASRQ